MKIGKNRLQVIATLALLGAAVMGGIFFAFSNFVMQALLVQSPESGIRAMQAINICIVNPSFLTVFFGTPLLLALLLLTGVRNFSLAGSKEMAFAAALYLVGSLGASAFVNMPLNNRLASLDPASARAMVFWTGYVSTWIAWNHVRTLSALAATVLLSRGVSQLRLREW